MKKAVPAIATVVSNIKDAKNVSLLTLSVPWEIAMDYVRPGQYLRLGGKGKSGYFAMASPPLTEISDHPTSKQTLTFIIKESQNSAWIANAECGTEIETSKPLGIGFTFLDHLPNAKQIFMFACGTGLAPIAAAIESDVMKQFASNGRYDNNTQKLTLFVGAKTFEHIPLRRKFNQWESAGIDIVPVLSKCKDKYWLGQRGYVQDSFKTVNIGHPNDTVALLCGYRGMVDEVTTRLLNAGVPKHKILLN